MHHAYQQFRSQLNQNEQNKSPNFDRNVKAKEIADYYDVTPATIYGWGHAGKIPMIEFEGTIRFHFESVRTAIEGLQQDDDFDIRIF